jgi:hypothetical protein
MKQGNCIEDTAILPGAAMRAGKRAASREVQKHRLPRGRLAQKTLYQRIGRQQEQDATQGRSQSVKTQNSKFSLAAVSAGTPPVVRRLLK